MRTEQDLTQQETHFAFGRNWAEYAEKITAADIEEAARGLERLLAGERLDGKRFLDVGSGSGLHSLAALRLGAAEVVATDIDPESLATTRTVLERHRGRWRAELLSVFDLKAQNLGSFDVVYSWGVLHHTGDMEHAIRCAAAMTQNGGRFVFALYRRILLDSFWRVEKQWYARATPTSQRRARDVYGLLFRLRSLVTGRGLADHIRDYRSNRGMNFWHDVHDWMGGWPYESISPDEVDKLMRGIDFSLVRMFASKGGFFTRHWGVFGSGCDEYVYQRAPGPNN